MCTCACFIKCIFEKHKIADTKDTEKARVKLQTK